MVMTRVIKKKTMDMIDGDDDDEHEYNGRKKTAGGSGDSAHRGRESLYHFYLRTSDAVIVYGRRDFLWHEWSASRRTLIACFGLRFPTCSPSCTCGKLRGLAFHSIFLLQ